MKKIFFLAFASMALLSACKKKDVEKTTAEKISGRWNVVSDISNDYFSNQDHRATIIGLATDYADFRADGKVYAQIGGQKDTSIYTIVSDNKINFEGDVTDIRTLTENQFVLYSKSPYGTSSYFERTLSLSR
jgi:hypothetical protein